MISERTLKSTLVCGLAAALGVLWFVHRRAVTPTDWIFWTIWPAMLLHQCEENVLTELVLGPRAAFLRWVRAVGYDLTAAEALKLNVGVGWTLAIASGVCGTHWVPLPLFVILVETVNGFWHLSVTALQRRWSPGTLSSVLVTVPLGFSLVQYSLSADLVAPSTCFAIFLAACLSHHLFLSSLPTIEQGSANTSAGPGGER